MKDRQTCSAAALACSAVALACSAVLILMAPANGAAQDSAGAYRAQVRAVSSAVAALAKEQRHLRRTTVRIPPLHLPPAPLGRAPIYSPSLDDWLQANLQDIQATSRRPQRAARLSALAATLLDLARLPGAASAPPQDAKRVALAIVARPAYKPAGGGAAPPPRESWWQRVWDWFVNLIDELFGRVFQGVASVPLIGRILAGALLLALAGAAVYGAYVVVRRFRLRRRSDAAGGLGSALPPATSPESLYDRALAAAAAGRFAAAVTLLFQASLLYLDSAGKVAYDAARTAGEYRRLVRRHVAPASPHFDALSGAFTSVAYAERPATPQDWASAESAFLALRPLVAS